MDKQRETIKCKMVTVTPAIGAEWLKRNQHNRSPKAAAIARYAADMSSGNWQPGSGAILINCNGELIDGQNRLLAGIQANSPFRTLVITGISRDVRYVVDTGAKRSFGDFLKIHEEGSPNELAAALTMQWKYDNVRLGDATAYPSYRQLHETLKSHPKMRQSVEFALKLKPIVTASLGAFLHFNGCRLNRDKTEEFLVRVKTGAKIGATNPAYKLREALIQKKTKGSRIQYNRHENVYWGITALNAYLAGRQLQTIRVSKSELTGEKFPRFQKS